jgi:flavin-dependent dehydrogenase
LPESKLINPINKINFFSPDETVLTKNSDNPRGYSVNLKEIEQHLFDSIKDKTQIRFENYVVDFDLENQKLKLLNGIELGFSILIFATGVLGVKFRGKLGVSNPKNVFCYAIETKGKEDITTIIDNKLAPGFYGWIIPLKDDIVELGFGAEELNIRDHEEINRRLFSLAKIRKYKGKKISKINGGFIPIDMIDKKSGKNWVIIGDAAGGEPMLGGSIHKCLDEAEITHKLILEYLGNQTYSLSKYEYEWFQKLGQDYESQKKIRKSLDKANNEKLNQTFNNLQGKEINGVGLINDLFRNIITHLENGKK